MDRRPVLGCMRSGACFLRAVAKSDAAVARYAAPTTVPFCVLKDAERVNTLASSYFAVNGQRHSAVSTEVVDRGTEGLAQRTSVALTLVRGLPGPLATRGRTNPCAWPLGPGRKG